MHLSIHDMELNKYRIISIELDYLNFSNANTGNLCQTTVCSCQVTEFATKVPAYNNRNLQCKLNTDATEGSACPQ